MKKYAITYGMKIVDYANSREEAVWAKAADNKKLTIEDIKQLRDTFLK